eukprot:6992694-Prymnesium_polylepis.1
MRRQRRVLADSPIEEEGVGLAPAAPTAVSGGGLAKPLLSPRGGLAKPALSPRGGRGKPAEHHGASMQEIVAAAN